MKKPEILSPAGNSEKMKAAFLYGADAVYLAGTKFGMRAAADNFTDEELFKACEFAHAMNKKVYITLNTLPRSSEYKELESFICRLRDIKPDAAIVADIAVADSLLRLAPEVALHISTQAGIVSAQDCNIWSRLGAKRVVLARELTLEEIREIRENAPTDMEIEAFVHGSMCVSFSGRCLLSNYFTGRDANRGMCAQPCRWNYIIKEEKRPDELPVVEEKEGTYIMGSKDMCLIEHIPELVEAGISSFKIEGRMKSAYYTAVVTNAYRSVLDGYFSDKSAYKFNPAWLAELESVSHREYCTGYYFDDCSHQASICTEPGYRREKAYIALAQSYDESTGLTLFVQRNKLTRGEDAELITPGKTGRRFCAAEMYDAEMNPIESVPHPMMEFYLKTGFPVLPGDIIRGV